MKASSKNLGRYKILATVAVPLLSWWFSWHYYHASKQAAAEGGNLFIRQSGLPTLQESRQTNASEQEPAMALRAKLTLEQMPASSIEFSPEVARRSTWNGPTDPDSVWHDQRRRANQTLVRHGLPSLEGGTTFPASPAPPHRPRVKFQK